MTNASKHIHHARAQLEPYTSHIYGQMSPKPNAEAMHEWRKWIPIADSEAVIGPEGEPVTGCDAGCDGAARGSWYGDTGMLSPGYTGTSDFDAHVQEVQYRHPLGKDKSKRK
ncbi:hypothetical protein TrVGV298_001805 [Trichoderma virens]|nr:hypothetical protein TrVGV298_001805 [Trichoderma virens]